MFENIKKWYSFGLWNKNQLRQAVERNIITKEQYKEITGETM